MMTRKEVLLSMKGDMLINEADKLGVKVACNKARTQLKESKQKVIDRILAFETSQVEEIIEEVVTVDEVDDNVVDNESELTDEQYAKIGLEIAEQAIEKSINAFCNNNVSYKVGSRKGIFYIKKEKDFIKG